MVIGLRKNRLRDDAARRERDPSAIVPIDIQSCVQVLRQPALEDGRTGRKRRQDRQQHANGGMQTGEFGIVGERQIQMDGLQIGPAMSAAIEDAMERFINDAVVVRPDHHLAIRIHPGMHAPTASGRAPSGSRIELMRRTLS